MNPFPSPSPFTSYLIRSCCEYASEASRRGWVRATAGNFSVRDAAESGLAWMSPSGVDKGMLSAGSFVAIDVEGSSPVCPQSPKPSDETALHMAIYRRFSYARAVMHVHSPALVKKSLIGEMEFDGHEMQKALGKRTHDCRMKVTCIDNSQDMCSLAREVPDLVGDSERVLVLRGHGVYAWDTSPELAMRSIEALEFLCAQYESS